MGFSVGFEVGAHRYERTESGQSDMTGRRRAGGGVRCGIAKSVHLGWNGPEEGLRGIGGA